MNVVYNSHIGWSDLEKKEMWERRHQLSQGA